MPDLCNAIRSQALPEFPTLITLLDRIIELLVNIFPDWALIYLV